MCNKDLEDKVRKALDMVKQYGLDEHRVRQTIQVGLDQKFITQKQVDAAQRECECSKAKDDLHKVAIFGINCGQYVDTKSIEYGLKHKVFTQKQVDAAQKEYECSRAKKALHNIEKGIVFDNIGVRVTEHEIRYCLSQGWITQKQVDAAQRECELSTVRSALDVITGDCDPQPQCITAYERKLFYDGIDKCKKKVQDGLNKGLITQEQIDAARREKHMKPYVDFWK